MKKNMYINICIAAIKKKCFLVTFIVAIVLILFPIVSCADNFIGINGSMSLQGNNYINYAFIPKQFTYGNEPCFVLNVLDSENNDIKGVAVYDENLDLKKNIKIPSLGKNKFPYKSEHQVRDVIVKQVSSKEVPTGLSLKDLGFEGYVDGVLNYIIRVADNGDSIVWNDRSEWDDNYYYPQELGRKYLKKYRVCKNGMIDSVFVDYNYEYSDWRVVESNEGDGKYSDVVKLYYCDANTGFRSDAGFIFSQTLFNQDELFEYVVPKFKSISGFFENYINSSKTFTTERFVDYYKTIFAGFQVISETGDVLQDIDLNIECNDDHDIGVLVIGSHTYLVIDGQDDSGNSKTYFYEINRETTSITQAKSFASPLLKVQPTITNKNSSINVNFGDSNTQGTSLVVFSSSGAKVMTQDVPSGQQNTQISLNVPTGMYHVSRMDNGKIVESRKIIIK